MTTSRRLKFGIFMGPFHPMGENPTLALERDLELIEWLDRLGYDEAWVGEHHSAGWETIGDPTLFLALAAGRTKHIRLGTGVLSLPYHHPFIVAERMVLLDHLTRGRALFGVGPGALASDAAMFGIDPTTQRPRMNEALRLIMRLFIEEEPITYQSDWFTLHNACLQLRPFTQPHMEMAVAAVQSPAGMVAAGEHGLGVLTFSVPRGKDGWSLREFWGIAEKTAAEHGKTVDRANWRVVVHTFLAESRGEAIRRMSERADRYNKEYQQDTLGIIDRGGAEPGESVAETQTRLGTWCIGTPDDLVAKIEQLQEATGGFGGVMVQAMDWADREHLLHSYELLARYVMPKFQGSLGGLETSRRMAAAHLQELKPLREQAISKAKEDYVARGGAAPGQA